MRILRSATDLDGRKFDIKQIFLDQTRYLQARTHHEEQTDERISQTIVRILRYQAKRRIFPGFPLRHAHCFDARGLEEYCFDGKAEPSLQATCLPFGAASASERPPAGPEKLALPSGLGKLGPNFVISQFISHANFALNNRPCATKFCHQTIFPGATALSQTKNTS